MLINEDYFKEIDITDDDITVNSSENLDSVRELYSYLQNNYDCTMMIPLLISREHKSSDIDYERIFSQVSKNISTLFDTYNIPHSELYLTCGPGYINDDISTVELNHKKHYTEIMDHYSDSFYDDTLYSNIKIFFRRPQFSNLKQVLKFMRILCNIIWHNENIMNFFRYISMYKNVNLFFRKITYDSCLEIYIHDYEMLISSTWDDINTSITNLTYRKMLYYCSEWFFGKRTKQKLVNAFNNNKPFDFTPDVLDKPYCQ